MDTQALRSRLMELYTYEPDTGLFRMRNSSNKRKAGEVAGFPTHKGYVKLTVDGKRYYAHRMAWLYHYGYLPEDKLIDHRNRKHGENWIDNLRVADNTQNVVNCKVRSDNKSGYRGVTLYRRRYRAIISTLGKPRLIGYFDTAEQAAEAYRAEAQRQYGEFVGA